MPTIIPKKLKVVCVEDEKWVCELVEVLIRAWFKDAEIVFLENGDDAWQFILQAQPEIFLTDGDHPGLHGNLLVERLASIKTKSHVVYTGCQLDKDAVERISGLGLNLTMLPKPFKEEEFWEKICLPLGPCENEDPLAACKHWFEETAKKTR